MYLEIQTVASETVEECLRQALAFANGTNFTIVFRHQGRKFWNYPNGSVNIALANLEFVENNPQYFSKQTIINNTDLISDRFH